MATLEELLTPLAMRVSKVPSFMAIPALRYAAQKFAQESLLWQHTNVFPATSASSYALTVPTGTIIAAIVASSLDGQVLRQGVDYELDGSTWCAMKPMRGTIKTLIALKTARDSVELGDELLQHYEPEIVAGAAAYLGAQENQPWSLSKLQLQLFQDQFDMGFQDARKRALNKANRLYEGQTRHEFF